MNFIFLIDGHDFYISNKKVLPFLEETVSTCYVYHQTQLSFCNPLHGSFFCPLNSPFDQAYVIWIISNCEKSIMRLTFEKLR
jgi:hypothetical protein